MKRCKYCGWWFEPKTNRSMYCDDECRKEADLISKRKWWRKNRDTKKPPSILKVDVSKLPPPTLPPTKEYKSGGRNLEKLFEMMERRRAFEG